MRLNHLLRLAKRSNVCIKTFVNPLNKSHFKMHGYHYSTQRKISTGAPTMMRITQDDHDSDNEIDPEFDCVTIDNDQGYARDLLFQNSKDLLLNRIYTCASVQELFNVLTSNLSEYNSDHITQTVLVLYDLKRIFDEINRSNLKPTSKEFLEKLEDNGSFRRLLNLIERHVDHFGVVNLSHTLFYLNKLGLGVESPTVLLLSQRLEKKLRSNFSISPAAKFLEVAFSDVNLRAYFMSQSLMPLVFKELEFCFSSHHLNDLTISLNKLHNIVTTDFLDKYKEKVKKMIKNHSVTSEDYKVILQIIAFLNYPKWRDKNSVLISECILLIKNNLNLLNVNEIIFLYEIFFKTEEPGEILSELQRCSSRHFHQLDDAITTEKIVLLSTIIYFSAPNMRNEFQKVLKKYVEKCDNFDNLLLLRKLLSHVKISDNKLCHLYWDKVLKFLKTEPENIDLIKLGNHYTNFSMDIDNYRHPGFENEILNSLEVLIKDVNYQYFPQKLSNILSFVLIYGGDLTLLEHLVANLEENWTQLRHIDCLKLAMSLRIFSGMDKKYIKLPYAQRIDKVLTNIISKEIEHDSDLWNNNALLKACIYKNNVNRELLDKLLMNYKNFELISSKNIENITYCFHVTNTLVPEVLDNIIKYIITYKDHILGFNVGRVVYLCYYLGYQPKHSFEFLKVVADIVIRDQERMTGLSLIQCALALCYFNKLPNSLIRSIFNSEFMDKLDHELQNCYSKEKYPQRVRNSLMQLNRAVCLDYPECNVPWFHQKYVEERTKVKDKRNNVFAGKIWEYLIRTVRNSGTVSENIITPYGYLIDFVVNLDSQDVGSTGYNKNLAVLLIPEFYYTRIFVQLKGMYQLKKRHLEMLGYRVVMVNFSDWISLFYAEERIDFLSSLIWPKNSNSSRTTYR